jgi:phosphatidylglycerophosphate synthase
VGADGLGYGSAAAASLGFLFYFISVVLDHVDGEVARLTHAESRLGALLDVWVDAVVNAAVVFGMGINVRAHGFAPGALLGLVGATGVMASTFAVKHWPPGSARSAGRALPLILDMLADRLGFHLTLGAYVLLLARAPERLPIVMVSWRLVRMHTGLRGRPHLDLSHDPSSAEHSPTSTRVLRVRLDGALQVAASSPSLSCGPSCA